MDKKEMKDLRFSPAGDFSEHTPALKDAK